MRGISHIFWLLLLVMPVSAKKPDAFDKAMAELFGGAMGRECLFWHLEDRNKRIDDQNHWVSLTGQPFGLVLQFGKKEKLVFPDGKSWAETPAGVRIPLLFKPMDAKALPGYWRACFSLPHIMGKGVYKYQVSLLIDGKERIFNHKLEFNSKQTAKNQMRSIQVGD